MTVELSPGVIYDEHFTFELDWAFCTFDDKCSYLLECLEAQEPPPARSVARGHYDAIEFKARATLALRVLEAALALDVQAREHANRVLDEAAVVREELGRANRAWGQAESFARRALAQVSG